MEFIKRRRYYYWCQAGMFELFGTCGYMLAFNITKQTEYTALVLFMMVLLSQKVSGGHLNPCISLGAFLNQKEYATDLCFLATYMLSQLLGALIALFPAYLLRVKVPRLSGEGYYFVPDQNPFYPAVVDETFGLSCYGQVFLAESIGAFLLVLSFLHLKKMVKSGDLSAAYFPFCYALIQASLN
jgi:glycerol uptake facilitator-like aquaporin